MPLRVSPARTVTVRDGGALLPVATLPPPFEASKRRWLVRERIDDVDRRVERTRELLGELTE